MGVWRFWQFISWWPWRSESELILWRDRDWSPWSEADWRKDRWGRWVLVDTTKEPVC